MSKKRVLVLMQADRVPPPDVEKLPDKEFEQFRADYDVLTALGWLHHEILPLGLGKELTTLRQALDEFKPHVVFNLIDMYRGDMFYDQHVVSYLELLGAAYTGCNPRGLILARDKALSKKILSYHRIKAPRFATFPLRRKVQRPTKLKYPLIVKPISEEGSTGIAQASVVVDDKALAERVQFIHDSLHKAAIAEQFIDGRELYVGVLGNTRLQALPIWELHLDQLPEGAAKIATYSVKWDLNYQEKHDIRIGPAKNLRDDLVRRLQQTAKRIYRTLGLTGYARMDFRLREDGEFFLLEANPNPDIAADEEFASAAKAASMPYEKLLERVINLGLLHQRSGYC
jgi:D-alanine-D-alanine ligase